MCFGVADAHRSAEHDESGKLLHTRNSVAAVEMALIELEPVRVRLRRDQPWALERNML